MHSPLAGSPSRLFPHTSSSPLAQGQSPGLRTSSLTKKNATRSAKQIVRAAVENYRFRKPGPSPYSHVKTDCMVASASNHRPGARRNPDAAYRRHRKNQIRVCRVWMHIQNSDDYSPPIWSRNGESANILVLSTGCTHCLPKLPDAARGRMRSRVASRLPALGIPPACTWIVC